MILYYMYAIGNQSCPCNQDVKPGFKMCLQNLVMRATLVCINCGQYQCTFNAKLWLQQASEEKDIRNEDG